MAARVIMASPIKELVSPKSGSGSLIYSVLVHGAICGLVVLAFMNKAQHAEMPEVVDLGYQTFDEPPPPVKEEKIVRHSVTPPTPTDTKVKVDNSPKEMQDEKSDVAGAQKAAPVQSNVGSTTNGTAEATPYYHIKPKYPREALVSGIEGWVLFKIDVNTSGEVENIRVVDGEQRNTFQSEARRALALWKYKPFLDAAGVPIKKIDHIVRIDFKLNETTTAQN